MLRLLRVQPFKRSSSFPRHGVFRFGVVNHQKFQFSQPARVPIESYQPSEPTEDVETLVAEYQRIQESGGVADLGLFNRLLKAYADEKNMLRIEEIDEAMSVLGVQKDQETYKILIHAYLSGKNIVKAEKAFYTYRKEIETKDPELYRAMINAYCKKQNLSEASIILRLYTTDGFPASLDLFNFVIAASVPLKNYSVAWHCFKQMEKFNIKPDLVAWNHLIDCLCRADRLDEALAHFRNMETRHGVVPDATTYEILVVAQVKAKWVQESEDLFVEMRNKGHPVNQRTWKYIIKAFARSSQMDKAFILVDQMLLEGTKPSNKLLPILQRRCQRTGKEDWYTQRFGEMKGAAASIISNEEHTKIRKKVQQVINYDWDVPGSPFSLVEFQNQLKKKKEMERKKEMEIMEQQFMLSIPPHVRAKIEQQKASLAKKRRAKTALAKSKDVAPTPKKKLKKKKTKESKPDPFTALDNLENQPKKKRTTPKDTRMPRSQFYWGRHRGPVAK